MLRCCPRHFKVWSWIHEDPARAGHGHPCPEKEKLAETAWVEWSSSGLGRSSSNGRSEVNIGLTYLDLLQLLGSWPGWAKGWQIPCLCMCLRPTELFISELTQFLLDAPETYVVKIRKQMSNAGMKEEGKSPERCTFLPRKHAVQHGGLHKSTGS